MKNPKDVFEDLPLDDSERFNVDTQFVQANIAQLIQLLEVDHEFFIEFFLPEQLDMDVPEFHGEIWSLLTARAQTHERTLLAIPRDHAKTTLAKLAVIWYWLFTPHRFCVYLSNTNAIAKGACKDIVGFLRCDNFINVFGKVEWEKESENESLWIFSMRLPNGKKKRCILRALGQGQQMRGINLDNQRPDIAVLDDVEDNENTSSETQQKSLDKWIYGAFLKALARKKKILWLGNMLTKTSLLARLSRNPRWNPVVFGALIKNQLTGLLEPLWPGKWTVESLLEDFREYKGLGLIETWMCEMMNMPGHGEDGFTADQIFYQPQPTPDDVLATWITIDPAFGKNAHNDESAITVHAILKGYHNKPMTVALDHGKWDEIEMFNRALQLAQYWNAYTWGIEAIAAQKVLITLFNTLMTQMNLNHKIEIVPLMSGAGDPKVGRIRAFVALMANKEWAIFEGDIDITTQLLNYDVKKKAQEDDIIDSCAYGPTMMDQYLPLIMAVAAGYDGTVESLLQSGTEVASV